MDEFWGKLITGFITAFATLLVCLINNYYQNKRERASRDEAHKKAMDEMQSTYLNEIGKIKEDYTGQVANLHDSIADIKHSVEVMGNDQFHAIELVNKEIQILSAKQEAYNNLQTRTYNLEKDVTLHEEQIKVANHRIEDLERK